MHSVDVAMFVYVFHRELFTLRTVYYRIFIRQGGAGGRGFTKQLSPVRRHFRTTEASGRGGCVKGSRGKRHPFCAMQAIYCPTVYGVKTILIRGGHEWCSMGSIYLG